MRILVRQNRSDLVAAIIAACTYGIDESRSPSYGLSYEDRWESLRQSIEHLRKKLGGRADQLLDMLAQARAHFDAGRAPGGDDWEITLGARLMQDMEEVVMNRPPFAYPEDQYRWPRPTIN